MIFRLLGLRPDPAWHGEAGPSGRGLFRLLGVGVLAWLLCAVAIIVWFFATVDDPGLMAVAMPFYAWGMAFIPGGLVMALYGLAEGLRRRQAWRVVAAALAVYLLPIIAASAVYALFSAVQPTAVTDGELPMMISAFGAPLFFLLYGAGLLLGFARRERPLRSAVTAVLLPPLAGVVAAAGFFAVYTVTAPQWRHRHDLALRVERVQWPAPAGLAVAARVTANRTHRVVMHAFYRDRHDGGGGSTPVQRIRIDGVEHESWTRTPIELRAGGSYTIRLEWDGLRVTGLERDREVILRFVEAPEYHGGELIREFRIGADPDPVTRAALERRLEPVSRDGGMGYANAFGNVVIEPRFDWADEFHEGLARVRIGEHFGFIDPSGELVIPARYTSATQFAEGVAGVMSNHRAGYISPDGEIVIGFEFDNAHVFSEGRARVSIDGREGFIDRSGELVIPPQWTWAHDFHAGLAAVRVGEKWGFIDLEGETVIAPQFEGLNCCSEGWRVMRDGRWGYVDAAGRLQMNP